MFTALRCALKAFSPESKLGLPGAGPSEPNDGLRTFSESLMPFPNVGLLLLGYSDSVQGVHLLQEIVNCKTTFSSRLGAGRPGAMTLRGRVC